MGPPWRLALYPTTAPGDLSWSLTAEQFTWLTAGVDWQRLSAGSLPAWTE
ncbi:hypothetical protein ACL60U_00205 (plasmid) [Escherichia coli]|nr:hypothetical protein [Escherichia coli]BDO52622.1 hypothetical protein TUM1881_51960 [Escherichia coli]